MIRVLACQYCKHEKFTYDVDGEICINCGALQPPEVCQYTASSEFYNPKLPGPSEFAVSRIKTSTTQIISSGGRGDATGYA